MVNEDFWVRARIDKEMANFPKKMAKKIGFLAKNLYFVEPPFFHLFSPTLFFCKN